MRCASTAPTPPPSAAASAAPPAALGAAGSSLVLNYLPETPATAEQARRMREMGDYASSVGEVQRRLWDPQGMEALLSEQGFQTRSHLTEEDLA